MLVNVGWSHCEDKLSKHKNMHENGVNHDDSDDHDDHNNPANHDYPANQEILLIRMIC